MCSLLHSQCMYMGSLIPGSTQPSFSVLDISASILDFLWRTVFYGNKLRSNHTHPLYTILRQNPAVFKIMSICTRTCSFIGEYWCCSVLPEGWGCGREWGSPRSHPGRPTLRREDSEWCKVLHFYLTRSECVCVCMCVCVCVCVSQWHTCTHTILGTYSR